VKACTAEANSVKLSQLEKTNTGALPQSVSTEMAAPPQGSFVKYIGLLKVSAVIIPSQKLPKQQPFFF